MSKILKNQTESDITLFGRIIPASGEFTIDPANYADYSRSSELIALLASGDLIYNDGSNDLGLSDAVDHLKDFLQKSPITEDGRFLNAPNRVPAGYSLYVTGEADNIAAGTFGGGNALKFSNTVSQVEFQLLAHYYVMSARTVFVSCDIDNYFNASLVAPATTGLTNSAGDFNKQALGGGANRIVPVAAGTGAWSMDLTAKLTNTQILKATPVPIAGNTGWFDYDSASNVLTPNMNQEGGYDLFDFEVSLHAFARKVWGTNLNGGERVLDVSDLVGKLIFNFWKIRVNFLLDGGLLAANRAAVIMALATKRNI